LNGRYDVAPLVLKGVQDNELHIFTHPDTLPSLEKRVERFLSTPVLMEAKALLDELHA
jgi:hypothetical protein